jgi:hypothetical protein
MDAGRIAERIDDFRPGGERGDHFGDGDAVRRIAGHLDEWGGMR